MDLKTRIKDLDTIIQVLEKQLHKKPVEEPNKYNEDIRYLNCPSCMNWIGIWDDTTQSGYVYNHYNNDVCPYCGQKIKWEKVNEMKPNEAIGIIKRERDIARCLMDDVNIPITETKTIDAYDMAIEALEKEIPQKTVFSRVNKDGIVVKCPRCGAENNAKMVYCQRSGCGQKLGGIEK